MVVYGFMYWIVMPLAYPVVHPSLSRDLTAVCVHMLLIGLPIALIVRRIPALNCTSHSSISPMTDPLDFSGKVVLVTGSSRGLGAEMIKAFGKRGAKCVVNYIADSAGQNKSDADAVAKELKDPLVIECDVTKPEQVEAMMKTIARKIWRPRHPDQQLWHYPRPHDQEADVGRF